MSVTSAVAQCSPISSWRGEGGGGGGGACGVGGWAREVGGWLGAGGRGERASQGTD